MSNVRRHGVLCRNTISYDQHTETTTEATMQIPFVLSQNDIGASIFVSLKQFVYIVMKVCSILSQILPFHIFSNYGTVEDSCGHGYSTGEACINGLCEDRFFTTTNQLRNAVDIYLGNDVKRKKHIQHIHGNSINDWCVSQVTDFSYIFAGHSSFNQDISQWDVSAGTKYDSMFKGASTFNQPLNRWNMSSAVSMQSMFAEASSFNNSISTWDVSSVSTFDSMFYRAISFNQPITSWNVSSGVNFRNMFVATPFNQPIANWDVALGEDFSAMFALAESFNQDISRWNMSSATDLAEMFYDATSFDHDLSKWDVSSVEDFDYMFYNAKSFSRDLCSAWLPAIKADALTKEIFVGTECPEKSSGPIGAKSGPLCYVCQE